MQTTQTEMLNTFHRRLKSLANNAGNTQNDIALATGIAQSSLSDYLSPDGKKTPSIYTAARLAQYYGVSIDYLLGYSDAATTDAIVAMEYTGLSQESSDLLHRLYTIPCKCSQIGLIDDLLRDDIVGYIDDLYGFYCDHIPQFTIISNALTDLAQTMPDDIEDISAEDFERLKAAEDSITQILQAEQIAKHNLTEVFWCWVNNHIRAPRSAFNDAKSQTQKILDNILINKDLI